MCGESGVNVSKNVSNRVVENECGNEFPTQTQSASN